MRVTNNMITSNTKNNIPYRIDNYNYSILLFVWYKLDCLLCYKL